MALGNGVLRWSMAKAAFNRRALSALVDRVICHKRITSQGAGQALGHYFANPSLPAQIQNYLLCQGSDRATMGGPILESRTPCSAAWFHWITTLAAGDCASRYLWPPASRRTANNGRAVAETSAARTPLSF